MKKIFIIERNFFHVELNFQKNRNHRGKFPRRTFPSHFRYIHGSSRFRDGREEGEEEEEFPRIEPDPLSRLISVTRAVNGWTTEAAGVEVFIGAGGTRRRYKRRFVSGVSRRQITESAAGTPWNPQHSPAGLRHPGIVAASGR